MDVPIKMTNMTPVLFIVKHFYHSTLYLCSICYGRGSVRLSVKTQSSTKVAKHSIWQTMPYNKPGPQFRGAKDLGESPVGSVQWGAKCRWRGYNQHFSTNMLLYLRNGK